MRLNPAKCTFGVSRGKVLGYMVPKRGIEADPRKIQAILKMQPPRSNVEKAELVGLLQYLSHVTTVGEPTLREMEKCVDEGWCPKCEFASSRLKEYLANTPILRPAHGKQPQLQD